jgi:hypothetical protein
MNNVGVDKLFNKTFTVKPITKSEDSKFFNDRNDEEIKNRAINSKKRLYGYGEYKPSKKSTK